MIVNVNTLLNYARYVNITSYARLMQILCILLSSFHNEMLISYLLLTAEFIADTVSR